MEETRPILLVDDEPTVQDLLATALEGEGRRVVVAKDCQEALRALEQEQFMVALVDKNLPDGDGLDLMRQVRKLDPEIELIVITGYGSMESALEAIEIGIFDYITKPFENITTLVQRVKRAMERRLHKEEIGKLADNLSATNRQLAASMQAMKRTYLETAMVITRLMGLRDPDRFSENDQVRGMVVKIALKLGVDSESIEWLSIAALLHDLGQAGEIEQIVKKPGPLDKEEYAKVKRHPAIGADLLESIAAFEPMAGTIRHHHEHYDGSGYPDGLRGEGIPLPARILAVAHAYVAMISKRPHRSPMSKVAALECIKIDAGSKYDPRVVDAFAQLQPVVE